MKPSLQQITHDSWRKINPAGLSDKQTADLGALTGADIHVWSMDYLVQHRRQLIAPERRLGHSWVYAPLRGAVRMRIGGKRWTVSENDLALIPAGVPHDAVALTPRFEVVTIHVRICLKDFIPDQPLFKKPVLPLPDPAQWHRELETIVSLQDERYAAILVRHLLICLAAWTEPLLPIRSDIDPRIRRAFPLMQQGVEKGTPLQDIRQTIGLCRSYFNRLFQEASGMSPRSYYKGLRIQGVLRLLRDPGVSIKEIAARLGYYDTQHLERDFKAKFGMPLGAFRKKL